MAAVAPLARLQAEDVERQELPAVRAHEAHGVEDELDSARRQVEGEAEAREAGTQDLRPGCVVPSAAKVELVLLPHITYKYCYYFLVIFCLFFVSFLILISESSLFSSPY